MSVLPSVHNLSPEEERILSVPRYYIKSRLTRAGKSEIIDQLDFGPAPDDTIYSVFQSSVDAVINTITFIISHVIEVNIEAIAA